MNKRQTVQLLGGVLAGLSAFAASADEPLSTSNALAFRLDTLASPRVIGTAEDLAAIWALTYRPGETVSATDPNSGATTDLVTSADADGAYEWAPSDGGDWTLQNSASGSTSFRVAYALFNSAAGVKSDPVEIASNDELTEIARDTLVFSLGATLSAESLLIPAGYFTVSLGNGVYQLFENVGGDGTEDSPYVVNHYEQLEAVIAGTASATLYVRLGPGAALSGTVTIPSSFESVTIDLNGGSITGDDGKAGVSVDVGTYLALTGSGSVSGGGAAVGLDIRPRVTVAESVTVGGGSGIGSGDGLLTLEVNGIRLIYRGQEDVSDIERLIRLILENGIAPVQAGK